MHICGDDALQNRANINSNGTQCSLPKMNNNNEWNWLHILFAYIKGLKMIRKLA